MPTTPQATLRARVAARQIVVAPGAYDALGAALAEDAGFDALYLSGASIAYTRLGRPDVGLVSMSEVADVLSLVRERVRTPIIVDADTGFGNALNVARTVRLFERLGAAAIQLEDQTLPKRCGHLAGKTLVSAAEMVGKLRAALDARQDDDTLIVARTDAIAAEGLEAALERAERYRQAGADVLFVEAPRSAVEIAQITARFAGRAPLLANMVEGGRTPLADAAELQRLGYSVAIFPGGLVRALAGLAREYFASLKAHGSNEPFRARMLDFGQLNELIGTAALLAAGQRFDARNHEQDDD